MPRRPRLHVPGGFYHITMRGNHRQRLFFNGEHRVVLDGLMSEACERYGIRVHAFCWMTNHLHMIVEVSDIPLGRVMMWVASRHARIVQNDLVTTGHLFERRYHALLVDKDAYLLELVRYIHLNPVHAGIVHDPLRYRWSSHGAYMGTRDLPWVTTDFVLRALHEDPMKARELYADFIRKGIEAGFDPTILIAHKRDPRVLGDDSFLRNVIRRPLPKPEDMLYKRSLDDIIDEACRRFGVQRIALLSPSRIRALTRVRAWVGCQALDEHICTLSDVARAFSRDESTLRELVKRHRPSFQANYVEDSRTELLRRPPIQDPGTASQPGGAA